MRKLPLWRKAVLMMVLPVLLWGWVPAGICAKVPHVYDPAVDPPPPSEFAVVAVHAYLYFQETGTIGQTDLIKDRTDTVDVILGGVTGSPSAATWVVVELERRPTRRQARQHLLLSATVPGGALLEKRLDVDAFFTEKDRLFIPFMVYGTGCYELKLRAVLSTAGHKETQAVEGDVPFTCNE